ncbi:MAG: ribonuclease III [Clostridia bacterium]|nr:ribonuclease III [Clostridia bacterium]
MIRCRNAECQDYPEAFRQKCAVLEERIGHKFSDPLLLYVALTHSSYSNEKKNRVKFSCNERLEFLGDSVLAIAVSRKLFFDFSDRPEGDLTRFRAGVVCEDALWEYAKKIDLGSFMLLGNGEQRGDERHKKSMLADCYEALIAAVYLDAGSEEAKRFVLDSVAERLENIGKAEPPCDYKSLLQQIVQLNKGEILEYELIGERGPDHDKVFVSRAVLSSNPIGVGEGRSKRESEQMAAKEALKLFGEIE